VRAEERKVERHQPVFEPTGKNQVHEVMQLFEEKNEQRKGIPVPRETQRSRRPTLRGLHQRQDPCTYREVQ